MAALIALSSDKHASLCLGADSASTYARGKHMMPIRVTEAAQASTSFSIFMTRQSDGKLALSAITSFQPGKNLFIADKVWQSSFQPANMQCAPFFLMQPEDGGTEPVLGIDSETVLPKEGGKPLFDASGKRALWLDQTKAILFKDALNALHTENFFETVGGLGLIQPLNLVVHYADGQVHTITGLQMINEDVLQTLSEAKFMGLREKGYLAPIYALLFSVFQLNALIVRNNADPECAQIKTIKLEVSRPTL